MKFLSRFCKFPPRELKLPSLFKAKHFSWNNFFSISMTANLIRLKSFPFCSHLSALLSVIWSGELFNFLLSSKFIDRQNCGTKNYSGFNQIKFRFEFHNRMECKFFFISREIIKTRACKNESFLREKKIFAGPFFAICINLAYLFHVKSIPQLKKCANQMQNCSHARRK